MSESYDHRGLELSFSDQMRSSLQNQYEGILPEKAIQGCLDFWEAVAQKIRNEALEEAAMIADNYTPREIAERIRKLKEGGK